MLGLETPASDRTIVGYKQPRSSDTVSFKRVGRCCQELRQQTDLGALQELVCLLVKGI